MENTSTPRAAGAGEQNGEQFRGLLIQLTDAACNRTNARGRARWDEYNAIVISTRQALLDQYAALRRDRERLDWLEAEHNRVDPVVRLVVKRNFDRNSAEWSDTIAARATIDAARQAGRTEGGEG